MGRLPRRDLDHRVKTKAIGEGTASFPVKLTLDSLNFSAWDLDTLSFNSTFRVLKSIKGPNVYVSFFISCYFYLELSPFRARTGMVSFVHLSIRSTCTCFTIRLRCSGVTAITQAIPLP